MSVVETAVGLFCIAVLTWVAGYVISVPEELPIGDEKEREGP